MAGSITNTYNTVLLGPGSVALKIFQPAACARTAGSVDAFSASSSNPITLSKSTTRSGRTAVKSTPVFAVNERVWSGATGAVGRMVVGAGGAPGAGACGAGCVVGAGAAGGACVAGDAVCADSSRPINTTAAAVRANSIWL